MRSTGGVPRKLLFEHIPKCGGITVTEYLRTHYASDRIFVMDGGDPVRSYNEFRALSEAERHRFDLVYGHAAHSVWKAAHPEMIKATIFRDPVDRVVSLYYYILSSPSHHLHQSVAGRGLSLQEFVTSGITLQVRNNYTSRFLQKPSTEVEVEPDESVDRAFSILEREYDVVGVLEHLNAVMEQLRCRAGFSEPFEGVTLNATPSRKRVAEIDPETRASIEEQNVLDRELYSRVLSIAPKTASSPLPSVTTSADKHSPSFQSLEEVLEGFPQASPAGSKPMSLVR